MHGSKSVCSPQTMPVPDRLMFVKEHSSYACPDARYLSGARATLANCRWTPRSCLSANRLTVRLLIALPLNRYVDDRGAVHQEGLRKWGGLVITD